MREEFRHRKIIKSSKFGHDEGLKKKVFSYFKMSYKQLRQENHLNSEAVKHEKL